MNVTGDVGVDQSGMHGLLFRDAMMLREQLCQVGVLDETHTMGSARYG